jgi:PmbA protein
MNIVSCQVFIICFYNFYSEEPANRNSLDCINQECKFYYILTDKKYIMNFRQKARIVNIIHETDLRDKFEKGIDYALKSGASGAKIILEQVENLSCTFEAGRLKNTGTKESLSINIEVIRDGKIGRSSCNRFDSIHDLIKKALDISVAGSPAHFENYPSPEKYASVKTHSSRTLSLTREKMIDSCAEISSLIKSSYPDVQVECQAERFVSGRLLISSGGVFHRSESTRWNLGASVQRTRDTEMLMSECSRSWRDLNEFYSPRIIASNILEDLIRGERTVESPSGSVKIFLPPVMLRKFMVPLFMGVNGRNVFRGESPLKNRLGSLVLDPSITITDNPLRDFATGARAVDDDGIPVKKLNIFKNGVLKCFLYDFDTAALAGTDPTGNNNCSPYSPEIKAGNNSSEYLISEIEDGLYVKDVIGFGQSNIINGDFSCNVSLGFRILNGKIVGRVKNTMISGNLYKIFSRNVKLSSDMDYEDRYPGAVINGINLSSKFGDSGNRL